MATPISTPENCADFDAFWQTLEWQPIADYDRDAAPGVILRSAGDEWDFGYWGEADNWDGERSAVPYDTPAWRHLKDWQAGTPLAFEPTRFAAINDRWAATLSED